MLAHGQGVGIAAVPTRDAAVVLDDGKAAVRQAVASGLVHGTLIRHVARRDVRAVRAPLLLGLLARFARQLLVPLELAKIRRLGQ